MFNIDGTIYIGAQNEIGKLVRKKKGRTDYVSLSDTISENIGDIWFTRKFDGEAYFFAEKAIYKYSGDELTVSHYTVDMTLRTCAVFNEGFIISFVNLDNLDINVNYYFDGDTFKKLDHEKSIGRVSPLKIYLHSAEKYLVFSYEGQVYTMERNDGFVLKPIPSKSIFNLPKGVVSSVSRSLNIFCVSTSKEGVYLFDKNGNFLRKIATENGLENLEIRDCMFDADNNLWLSNDYGISKVDLSSPITYFDKSKGVVAASEVIKTTNNHNVVGSRSGIFYPDTVNGSHRYKNSEIFNYECFSLVDVIQ